MPIICINAMILYWVPNSSQVRASKTLLQIILKLMIGDIIKCYVPCATSTTWFYLDFHISCGFIFTGAQVSLHWRWCTFDAHITWLIQPREKKKILLFGQIDFLNQLASGDPQLMPRKERGKRKKGIVLSDPWLQPICTRIKSDLLNYP